MILSRRPLLFDVDAAGIAAAVMIAVGAWGLVIAPYCRTMREHAVMTERIDGAAASRDSDRRRAVDLERQTKRLREVVESSAAAAPAAAQRNDVLARLIALAGDAGLQIGSFTPVPSTRAARSAGIEAELVARGDLNALVAFLARLEEEYPGHAIDELTLAEEKKSDEALCAITLRLRVFLVEEPKLAVTGARP